MSRTPYVLKSLYSISLKYLLTNLPTAFKCGNLVCEKVFFKTKDETVNVSLSVVWLSVVESNGNSQVPENTMFILFFQGNFWHFLKPSIPEIGKAKEEICQQNNNTICYASSYSSPWTAVSKTAGIHPRAAPTCCASVFEGRGMRTQRKL